MDRIAADTQRSRPQHSAEAPGIDPARTPSRGSVQLKRSLVGHGLDEQLAMLAPVGGGERSPVQKKDAGNGEDPLSDEEVLELVNQALAGVEGDASAGSCKNTADRIGRHIFVATQGKLKPDQTGTAKHYVLRIGNVIVDPTAAQFVNYPEGWPVPVLVGTRAEVEAQLRSLVGQHGIRSENPKAPGTKLVKSESGGDLAAEVYDYEGSDTVYQTGESLKLSKSGKKAEWDSEINNRMWLEREAKQKEAAAKKAAAPEAETPAAGPEEANAEPAADASKTAAVLATASATYAASEAKSGGSGSGASEGASPPAPKAPSKVAPTTTTTAPAEPESDAPPAAAPEAAKAAEPKKDLAWEIERQRKAALTELGPLRQELAAIDAEIATDPTKKASAAAKKKELEAREKALETQAETAGADLALLADPTTPASTMNELLARRNTGESRATSVESDEGWDIADGKATNTAKTVTSSLDKGVATTREQSDTFSIGEGGAFSKGTRDQTKTVAGDKTTTTAKSSSKTLDLTGGAFGHSRSEESSVEEGGAKKSEKTTTSGTLSAKGYSHTKTKSKTEGGTTTSTSSTTAFERGDGKLGFGTSKGWEKVGADGSEKKASVGFGAGIVDDESGKGAYTKANAGGSMKGAKGASVGASVSMHGSFAVKEEPIPGTDPQEYWVTTTRVGGAGGSVSGGYDKKGGGGSVSASLSGEASTSANVVTKKRMTAGEKAVWVAGLAVGGSNAAAVMGAAKKTEADIGTRATSESLKDGERVEVKLDDKAGLSGEASVGYGMFSIGGGGGASTQSDRTLSIEKKGDKDELQLKIGDADDWEAHGKLGVGPASASLGKTGGGSQSRTVVFAIDPKRPDYEAVIGDLKACRSQAELEAFQKRYPDLAAKRVDKQMSYTGTKGSLDLGKLNVIGAESKGIYEKSVVHAADGTIESGDYTGTRTSKTSLLGLLNASTKDTANVHVEGGKMTGSFEHEQSGTNVGKSLEKLGDNLAKDPLAVASGGADSEVQSTRVAGHLMRDEDFSRIIALANDPGEYTWSKAAGGQHFAKGGKSGTMAFFALRDKIRAAKGDKHQIADAIAAYAGGSDDAGRVSILENLLGDARSSDRAGIGFDLPPSLAHLKGTYAALVMDDPLAEARALADAGETQQAAKLSDAVQDRVNSFVYALTHTDEKMDASKLAEMVNRLERRNVEAKNLSMKLYQRLAGGPEPDPEKTEESEAWNTYESLKKICSTGKGREQAVFNRMSDVGSRGSNYGKFQLWVVELEEVYAQYAPAWKEMAEISKKWGFEKEDPGTVARLKPDKVRYKLAKGSGEAFVNDSIDPNSEEARRAQEEADYQEEQAAERARESDELARSSALKFGSMMASAAGARTNEEKAHEDAHVRAHAEAAKRWGPIAKSAYDAATNASGKCNGMHNKGRANEIKPEAAKIWSEGFQALGPLNQAWQEFSVYSRDSRQSGAPGIERAAQVVIQRANEAKAIFERGNAIQG